MRTHGSSHLPEEVLPCVSAGAVLSQQSAREMPSPVDTGPVAAGLQLELRGQGWCFMHSGATWGCQCDTVALCARATVSR
jgi:hypothetical protein